MKATMLFRVLVSQNRWIANVRNGSKADIANVRICWPTAPQLWSTLLNGSFGFRQADKAYTPSPAFPRARTSAAIAAFREGHPRAGAAQRQLLPLPRPRRSLSTAAVVMSDARGSW